ncbi:hypothetical protein QFZ32_009043 [Streptomyces canus]|nr:hypothetical protein [Streptomyces canus]
MSRRSAATSTTTSATPVDVDGRTIQYVVSGGGGAFMHATHTIPHVSIANVTERDFRCYPLRGDSLAFYSRLYGRRLHLRRFFTLTEAEATAVIAERLGIPPTRLPGEPARVTFRIRLVASLLGAGGRPDRASRFRLPVRKIYTQLFSPGSATYSPPFFKCFLRLDVTPEAVLLRCLRGHRQPRPGDRPAGRGRGDHSLAPVLTRRARRRGTSCGTGGLALPYYLIHQTTREDPCRRPPALCASWAS